MRLPSAITRRRVLLALWLVATALAVAVVLGATRLLGHQDSSRKAVARYILSVDTVQQQMRFQLTELLNTYRGFSTKGTSPQGAAKLAGAERTLRMLDGRLAALPAPADASKLRALLLELVQEELSVARELSLLAGFMPRFHALIAAATTADARLSRDLAGAAPPKPHAVRGTAKQIARAKAAYAAQATKAAAVQADAVDAYDRVLAQIVRSLEVLHPPAVMAPAYRTEVQTLEVTRAAGHSLAVELRKRNRTGVPQLSRAFTRAARLSGSLAAQRSEIAAVKAYNARVRRIGTVQARVQAEVGRLQRELG